MTIYDNNVILKLSETSDEMQVHTVLLSLEPGSP